VKNKTLPKGLRDTGQSITLPLPIFDLMLEGGHLLDVPTIPLYEIAHPLDNRICCPYARRNDAEAAATCEWATDPNRTGCKLGDGRPCLFDEPDDSEMWQWVREQRAIQEELERQGKGEAR
jgi:hypothetical protein